MIVMLSGEGKSDLGVCKQPLDICEDFAEGPMTKIIDKLLKPKLDYSISDFKGYLLVSKNKITRRAKLIKPKKKMPLPGAKKKKDTGYFWKNANALGQIAKEKKADIAILFSDSDGTNTSTRSEWKDKVESIRKGFEAAGFKNGVAMVPKPVSEAWILCAVEKSYQNCPELETLPGNEESPNHPKKKLKAALRLDHAPSAEELSDLVSGESFDVDKIDMRSFNLFKKKLFEALVEPGVVHK